MIWVSLGAKSIASLNKDAKCILLVDGNKLCVFDETMEEQISEKREIQFGFCPLLPTMERNRILASLKEEGFSKVRSFRSYCVA